MLSRVHLRKQLLLDVERIEVERSAELLAVRPDLDQLKSIVRQQLVDPDENVVQLTTAVRALIYLRDPYDAVMDQHVDLGLNDDRERIRTAARELAVNHALPIADHRLDGTSEVINRR